MCHFVFRIENIVPTLHTQFLYNVPTMSVCVCVFECDKLMGGT